MINESLIIDLKHITEKALCSRYDDKHLKKN